MSTYCPHLLLARYWNEEIEAGNKIFVNHFTRTARPNMPILNSALLQSWNENQNQLFTALQHTRQYFPMNWEMFIKAQIPGQLCFLGKGSILHLGASAGSILLLLFSKKADFVAHTPSYCLGSSQLSSSWFRSPALKMNPSIWIRRDTLIRTTLICTRHFRAYYRELCW